MILLGADQSAAPASLRLWWMTRHQSRQWERKVQTNSICRLHPNSWVKIQSSFFKIVYLVQNRKLQSTVDFSFFLLYSTPHVPAHILHAPARAASDPPEETLHWEGDPHQRATVSATHQTQLQVSGECAYTEYPQSNTLAKVVGLILYCTCYVSSSKPLQFWAQEEKMNYEWMIDFGYCIKIVSYSRFCDWTEYKLPFF